MRRFITLLFLTFTLTGAIMAQMSDNQVIQLKERYEEGPGADVAVVDHRSDYSSVTMQDPLMSAVLTDTVMRCLQNYMVKPRLKCRKSPVYCSSTTSDGAFKAR